MTKIATPIIAGILILATIVGLSTLIFGDETNTESVKSLWVIIPVLGLVLYFLLKNFNKK